MFSKLAINIDIKGWILAKVHITVIPKVHGTMYVLHELLENVMCIYLAKLRSLSPDTVIRC